jgi:hypothetical protein
LKTPASPRTILPTFRAWLLLTCLSLTNAFAQQPPYPRPADVTTLDSLMLAYYEVVSGGPGVPRDVARDLSLHHPDAAIFIHKRNEKKERELVRVSVKEYHANAKANLEAGFFERETKRETKTFGHSVQVWSTYETRKTPDGPVTARGINNIILSFDGKRYWILAETWDDESKANPLP